MSARREKFLAEVSDVATHLAMAADRCANIAKIFGKRGYGTGSPAAFTAEELAAADLTQAQLDGFVTLCQQLGRLLDNKGVTQGDYDAILQSLRRDL